MPNYNNGKIYKIWSPSHPDDIYIGSTTQPLSKRIGGHRVKYKRYQKGKYHYVTSFKILEYGDARIELIQDCKCERVEQLTAREGYYIRTLDCVNKINIGRTGKQYREANKEHIAQYHKQYREANKEQIRQREKQYREANKKKIAQYDKQRNRIKITCECGTVVQRGGISTHKKTNKHKRLLQALDTAAHFAT